MAENPMKNHEGDWVLFIPEERRLREDLIDEYKYLQGKCKENGARLISVVPSDRKGGMITNKNTGDSV